VATTRPTLSGALDRAREQVDRWRRTRSRRTIPDGLWSTAIKLAAEYGVFRTSRALRVDYYSLKSRLASTGVSGGSKPPVFVDLMPATSSPPYGEGMAELLDPSGAKIRIEWRGSDAPDLAALSRSFFGGAS
jgi:hypothetical protein